MIGRITALDDKPPDPKVFKAGRKVSYQLWDAREAGETRHAVTVMEELAEKHGFRILKAEPQTLGESWWFWIEYETEPVLPSFIYRRKGEW